VTYQLGQPPRRHYRLYGILLLAAICFLGGLVWQGRQLLQSHTTLTQSHAYVGTVTANTPKLHTVTKQNFSIGLPQGWNSVTPSHGPYTMYSWRGSGEDVARQLDLYIDIIPANLAVNRLLQITPAGDHFSITGSVSDNCTQFTTQTASSAATGVEAAQLDGVNFLCDVGNSERDVVGTGSVAGVNTAVVSGPATGEHKVFFAYTDNSNTPDYVLLEDIIESFRAL